MLTSVVAAASLGLSSHLQAEPLARGNSTCSVVTQDLRGQIENLKLLKARSDPSRPGFSSKKTESPSQIFAREREQADALNGMLPGMGCARLDIDYELTQPINHALLPIAQKKSKKHHKKP